MTRFLAVLFLCLVLQTASASAEAVTPSATVAIDTATSEPVPVDTATLGPYPIDTPTSVPFPIDTATFGPVPVDTTTFGPFPIDTSTFAPAPTRTAPIGSVPTSPAPTTPVATRTAPNGPVPTSLPPIGPLPTTVPPTGPVPVGTMTVEPSRTPTSTPTSTPTIPVPTMLPQPTLTEEPKPNTHVCCLCMVNDPADGANQKICTAQFDANKCDAAEPFRQTLKLGKSSDLAKDFIANMKGQEKTCSAAFVTHADHSWSTGLPDFAEAGKVIRDATGVDVRLDSLGCGAMVKAEDIHATLTNLCTSIKAAPSLTIKGNQGLVTLDGSYQLPATFTVPDDCNKVAKVKPLDVLSIAAELPQCADYAIEKKNGCFAPNSYPDQVPNSGNAGAIACRNGEKTETAYCVFTPDGQSPPVSGEIAKKVFGYWSTAKPEVIICEGFMGMAAYPEIPASKSLNSQCVFAKDQQGPKFPLFSKIDSADGNKPFEEQRYWYCVNVNNKDECTYVK